MIDEKIIFAGFGGQGVMKMGQVLTYSGMVEDKHVSWLPSYGPEMRGGTANCNVMVSEHLIGSPIITNDATSVVAMNLPSLDKFESNVVSGGNIFVNSSLIERKVKRDDVNVFYIPCNEIANELGSSKIANMVMLGAYLAVTSPVEVDTVMDSLIKVFGAGKEKYMPLNKEAIKRGIEEAKKQM